MRTHYITQHAAEQFIRRWEPSFSFAQAHSELNRLLTGCRSIGKSPLGDQIMVSGERPDIRMIVKDFNVCVTVLPRYKEDEEIEQAQLTLEDIEHEKEQRIASIKEELAICCTAIQKVDEERRALGEQKSRIQNKRKRLEHELNLLESWDK